MFARQLDELLLNKQGTKEFICRYYSELEVFGERLLENADEVIKVEEIFELVLKRQGPYCDSNTIWNMVYDCFRKYVLELVRSGQATPKVSCILLKEYADNPNEGPNKDDELALQRILSYFKRKQFDYFINRYYLFNEVNYNRRMERRIAKLMKGRGIAWPIRWKRTKLLTPGNTNYVGYLDSMPEFFLLQIGMKKELDSHPEADVWGMRQASYRMVRLMIVPYIILMILYIISKIV